MTNEQLLEQSPLAFLARTDGPCSDWTRVCDGVAEYCNQPGVWELSGHRGRFCAEHAALRVRFAAWLDKETT